MTLLVSRGVRSCTRHVVPQALREREREKKKKREKKKTANRKAQKPAPLRQEPRKGGFSKGVSAESSVTLKETNNTRKEFFCSNFGQDGYIRREYHQSCAQPAFRAEKKRCRFRAFSAHSPVFGAKKGRKKTRAQPWYARKSGKSPGQWFAGTDRVSECVPKNTSIWNM